MADEKILTSVPKDMEVVKPVSTDNLSPDQWRKYFENVMDFTAPALVVLFTQLALGADWQSSAGLFLYAFYGLLRDYFKKRNSDTPYLREK